MKEAMQTVSKAHEKALDDQAAARKRREQLERDVEIARSEEISAGERVIRLENAIDRLSA